MVILGAHKTSKWLTFVEAGVNTNCNICVHKAPIYVHIQVFGTIYRIIKDLLESNNLYIYWKEIIYIFIGKQ